MPKKKTNQRRSAAKLKSEDKPSPKDAAVSESGDFHWEEFTIEGTRAIQLHVASEDWQDIAQAASTFWKRAFSEFDGRRILGIQVVALPDLGFDLKAKTTPQIRETRLELCIDRMEEDCMLDPPECDQQLEAAWQALERGLHVSKVLSTHKDALDADFELLGRVFPKAPTRNIKPRRR